MREQEGWKPGQTLAFVPDGKHFVLVAVPPAQEIFGSMMGANPDNYRDRNDRY